MVQQRVFEVHHVLGTFLCILAYDDSGMYSADYILRVKYGSTATWKEVDERSVREWPAECGHPIIMTTGYL